MSNALCTCPPGYPWHPHAATVELTIMVMPYRLPFTLRACRRYALDLLAAGHAVAIRPVPLGATL